MEEWTGDPPDAAVLLDRTADPRQAVAALCTLDARRVTSGVAIALRGQLCFASAPGIGRELLRIRDDAPVSEVDLRGLTFVDLSGLDMLRTVLGPLEPDGWPTKVELGAKVTRLIELLGMASR